MLVLYLLHAHHIKQHDFGVKSVAKVKFSVVYFLNKPECMRFINITTMLSAQTEVV